MSLDGVEVARRLVREMFPRARAAWLGGSVALGIATATSDLDITVLLDGPPAPYRESLRFERWPVELFVQTQASIEYFRTRECAVRRPSTLRLIGQAHILLDTDGSGARLRDHCASLLAAGPEPLTDKELRAARYRITDLLDDLAGSRDENERLMIAAALWQATADLLLTGHGHWTGGGKWLHRELSTVDPDFAQALATGMRSVAMGSIEPMTDAVERSLKPFGGRLFHGYHEAAPRD
ncbi:nucleotidyltransferase domain-containing protein [Nocardia sp. NPDC004068]|uniref:nucleotidyltransferase domain-containing protein n=1 Tax=Nocardia sp. NPDC004068 TaxID=3364303 RepID=UPI00367D4392